MLGRRLAIVGMIAAGVMLLVSLGAVWATNGVVLTDVEELGKSIFFDEALSLHENQSCASCHGSEVGFTGPLSATNEHGAVYEGSVAGLFGERKPPSAAYATQSPIFHLGKHDTWTGGNFWDGRATGELLGNPAADQAQGPFLNPVEQALPDSACVVHRVCTGDYGTAFEDVWGAESCDIPWATTDVETVCELSEGTVNLSETDRATSDMAYDQIALSVAAYEASPEVNAFTSQYDSKDKLAKLTKEEQRGRSLFQSKGKCSACHPSNGKQPLFTDFTFDNLGVPPNPENPVYTVRPDFVDLGLGGFLGDSDEDGKQKVPTLRNVDLRPSVDFVKAYTHNGYFKTLEGIVHFYNTRDTLPVCEGTGGTDTYTEKEALDANCWPAPEVEENVNTDELGDLGLSSDEEAAIVAFLRTLSDGYTPP